MISLCLCKFIICPYLIIQNQEAITTNKANKASINLPCLSAIFLISFALFIINPYIKSQYAITTQIKQPPNIYSICLLPFSTSSQANCAFVFFILVSLKIAPEFYGGAIRDRKKEFKLIIKNL